MADQPGSNDTRIVRLRDRASSAGVDLDAATAEPLADYLALIHRWNARMNLTALEDPDRAIDRLIVEPLAAATHVPPGASLIDIGSGNGSPAIPLRIARPDLAAMRLVESRMRKGVFLREAIRQLQLNRVVVENHRYEALLSRADVCGAHDILTLRGVAWDAEVLQRLRYFVRPGGRLCLFAGDGGEDPEGIQPPLHAPLAREGTYPLIASLRSRLIMVRVDPESKATQSNVPRGTPESDCSDFA